MFDLNLKKSSRYLKEQEKLHFNKSNRYFLMYLVALGLILLLLSIAINVAFFKSLAYSIGLLAFSLLLYANEKLYIPYRIHERKWDGYLKGLVGESRIQKELENLPSHAFSVFQHIEILKNGDVDFVVVGQGSVFAIEAKQYSGSVMTDGKNLFVNGNKYPSKIIRKAKERARIIHSYINPAVGGSLFIHPVVVFAGRRNILTFEPCMVDGVFVCNELSLIGNLAKLVAKDGKISEEDNKKICEVIDSLAQIRY